jgi:hypothetical protein
MCMQRPNAKDLQIIILGRKLPPGNYTRWLLGKLAFLGNGEIVKCVPFVCRKYTETRVQLQVSLTGKGITRQGDTVISV